jgi:lipopolysaccharide export system protein LptA
MALDGRLERVIASTDVIVQEPGRRATGDRLSYTAADGTVVLTGTAKTPPVVVDTAQGSRISAAAFRFRNDGETVEALSAAPEGAFERQVRTQTTVRKR